MKLKSLPHFFLDLQTTGSKPDTASILEMAFCNKESSQSFLVEQPEGHEIPKRIQFITGVKNEDMKQATPFPEAMRRLMAFAKDHSNSKDFFAIIHFAQFEKPFLDAAFAAINAPMPFTILCTHDIAKRLLPNLPTRGIKGLAGYFGYDAGELKRSLSHVEATAVIWEKLLQNLEEKNITTLDELNEWLIETPKATRSKYEYPLPKEKRLNLPNVPGIYRMLNFKGEVLYVGKATSLKSRVNSYFRGQKKRDPKKLEMLAQVMDLHVTTCSTPLEAALMETDEIKRLNPRYNISLKVGRRSLVFFDRDFIESSPIQNDHHTIGPFSNSLVFESMMSLSQSLKQKSALPDELTFYEPLDPVLIKEGFELFCQKHNFNPELFASMRSVVATGILWHRRHQRSAEMAEEIVKEDVEESSDETEKTDDANKLAQELAEEVSEVLTPEDLAQKFVRHFIRIGGAYLRARKLNRILNSDIDFQLNKKNKRKIHVRDGKITYDEAKSSDCLSATSWREHSIETYDRMTVLLSELDRVKTQSGSYEIHYHEASSLSTQMTGE